ncbi:acyl-CoA thioesterase, partial [Campylobacter jejuni]|nr:acyl-CoA thioesterase [Campylobacter jejuni]
MKMRVYYEDTDAGGVVYHSNYLKFCERVRSEIFFNKKVDIFDASKGHFLLAKANCNFLKPAKLGDM